MNEPGTQPDRERQLDEIVAAYLEAYERLGTRSREEWLARYPAFRNDLRDFFEAEDLTRRATRAAGRASDLTPIERVRIFDDFELLEEIGRGGMGIVYRARQKSLNRIVALKTIMAAHLATQEQVSRFHTEAVSAARLKHPHVVTVYQVGEYQAQPFFCMEYVEGQSLREVISGQPLELKRAARYLKAVAEAIQYAHEQGVQHRDLKPSNILLDSTDQPQITDFGLARLVEEETTRITVSGVVLGTPSYMPPEQAEARRGQMSERSDVYSLGAILYEMISGVPPFRGRTRSEILAQVVMSEPIPPRAINPKVPPDLETICLRCLEKEPARRYPPAGELAADLERFLEEVPVYAQPVATAEKVWRWCRRQSSIVRLKTKLATVGLILGPLLALLIGLGPRLGLPVELASGRPELNSMTGILALMAVWWLTEAIPLAATAFVPLILYPLAGIMGAEDVAQRYAADVIFLFLGGFLIGIAVEQSGLPRRVALSIVALAGASPQRVVLGFMVAAGALSMWMSNTVSTIIMLPIAVSFLYELREVGEKESHHFATAIMLGIAYAANIGGTATLVGTPPNLAFQKEVLDSFGRDITFLSWMAVGLPFALLMGLATWMMLVYRLFPLGERKLFQARDVLVSQLQAMGRVSVAERRMLGIGLITALLWVFRMPVEGWGWAVWLGVDSHVEDGTVAMAMALLCFVVPSGEAAGQRLLHWRSTARLPWGVLFLFGGGLALASGMEVTGLDKHLGNQLAGTLRNMPSRMTIIGLILVLAAAAAAYQLRKRGRKETVLTLEPDNEQVELGWRRRFLPLGLLAGLAMILVFVSEPVSMLLATSTAMAALTELMTNLATVEMMLPLLSEAAKTLAIDPRLLLLPATLAASCAFMLPVATAPNAIVFGSGKVKLQDMLRAGLWLNVLAVIIIALCMTLLLIG